jgi:hypothetical protein
MDFLTKIKIEMGNSKISSKIGTIGISETTIKKYIDKLKVIFNQADETEYLNNIKNLNTALAYYGAIFGSIKHSATAKKYFEDHIDDYTEKYKLLMDKSKNGNVKTADTQTEEPIVNVDWKTIIKKTNNYTDITQDQMLMNIYTLISPKRLDYNRLFITRNQFIPENEHNYIQILSKTKSNIVLNEYKTSKKYGTQETKLSAKLAKIIWEYIHAFPEKKYLFETETGKSYANAESFGKYLRTVFSKALGEPISVNTLRHSWVTYTRRNDLSKKEKLRIAIDMGHSAEVANDYDLN